MKSLLLLFLFPCAAFAQVSGTGVSVSGIATITVTNNVNSFDSRAAGTNVPGGVASIVSSHTFDAAFTLPHCASGPCTTHGSTGTCTNGINEKPCSYIYYKDQPNSLQQDCTTMIDGHCSLSIVILNGYFQGEPGSYEYNFCPSLSCTYGTGQEFYVQYEEKLDAGVLGNIPNAEGMKHDITTEGDTSSVVANDCGNSPAEIVTIQDGNAAKYPTTYMNCGFSSFTHLFGTSGYQLISLPIASGPNFLDQNASGCPVYSNTGIQTTDPTCWNYVAGEVLTIQKHVKMCGFGDSNTCNVVEVWMAHQGQPAVLITNAVDAAIPNSGALASGKYGKISLSAYNTAANWNVNTGVWYGPIIVATRRVPEPGVSTPNEPDSLTLSNVAYNSVQVNWRVNSANGTAQDDTGFLVERCTGDSKACFPNPQSGFAQIGTTAAGAAAYTDNSVAASTTYTYRVRAKNATGNSGYAIAQCFNGGTTCGGTVTTPAVANGSWLPGAGGHGWTQFSSGTNITSVCPANNFNGTSYAWASNCHNVVDAWSGGFYDQSGHRLIMWGGGHNDYPGNEIYTLNLGTSSSDPLRMTINRITDPTTTTQSGAAGPANQGGDCANGWLSDGKPNARHSGFGMVVDTINNRFYFLGGGVTCQAGSSSSSMGYLNLTNLAWTRIDSGSGAGSGSVPGDCGTCLSLSNSGTPVFDPSNQHIYFGNGSFSNAKTYEWTGTTSTQRTSSNGFSSQFNGMVFDTTDNKIFEYGNGDFKVIVPGTWGSWADVGCNSTCAAAVAGVSAASYDSVNNVIYFYTGSGNTVYKYAPASNTWTSSAINSNPCTPSAGTNGIFNRFQFDSTYQVGVLVNDATQQACLWRP